MKIIAITLAALCLISVFAFSTESMRTKKNKKPAAKKSVTMHYKDCDVNYSFDKGHHHLKAHCKDGKKDVDIDLSACKNKKHFSKIKDQKKECALDSKKHALNCQSQSYDLTKELLFKKGSVEC